MNKGLQEYTAQKWALSFDFKRKSDRNISAKKKKNQQQQQKLRTNLDFSGAHRSIFRSYVVCYCVITFPCIPVQ